MKRCYVLIVAIWVMFIPSIVANDIHSRNVALRTCIDSIMKEYGAIGVNCVVVKKNRIVYSCAMGYNPNYTDSAHNLPLDSEGLYYWASVSKTFVGTAIMQLSEKGKIDLNDDVNKYLKFSVRNPSYPNVPITIKMLLSHRGSLNKLAPYSDFSLLMKNDKKLWNDYEPGSKLEYSNLGFVILGAVIENVSEERFDDYINNHILVPLGIYGGYDVSRLDSSRFVRTYRYQHEKGIYLKQNTTYSRIHSSPYVLGISTPQLRPAGGIIMSAGDMARYMMMHINNGKLRHGKRVLSKKSERYMREKQYDTSHGLSMVHFSSFIPSKDLFGMTGGARGIHSLMVFEPDGKFGFVVICNGCQSKKVDGSDMSKEIVRALYVALFEKD